MPGLHHEIQRIKSVYRRRNERALNGQHAETSSGEVFMAQRREQAILRLLRRNGMVNMAKMRVLEVGCGRGGPLADWARWGAEANNLYGVDLMEPFVKQAVALVPGAGFVVGTAHQLPFPDCSFDVVAQLTMFTSILDPEMRYEAAIEMRRVLAPAGAILWYDFRYPSPYNHDVRPVRWHEIRALFPGWHIDSSTITLLPPITRRLAPISFQACTLLEWALPPLRSHYVALLTRSR